MSADDPPRPGRGLVRRLARLAAGARDGSAPAAAADDASTWASRALALSAVNDKPGLRALADRLLAAPSADVDDSVAAAVVLRDRRLFPEAERVFGTVLERRPAHEPALHGLALTRLRDGRHVTALAAFEDLLRVRPDHGEARLLCARLLYATGDPAEGAARLRALDPEAAGYDAIRLEWALGDYLTAFPHSYASQLARRLKAERYVPQSHVAEGARRALQAGTGFSFIRLGDGEGAFCPVSAADQARFAPLYRACRVDRARVWFGDEIDVDACGFTEEAFGLRDVIRRADVVGAPYPVWVDNEYAALSVTGVPTLTNILRFLTEDAGAARLPLVRQAAHIELWQSGDLAALIRGRARLGLIACHDRLPDQLRRAFDIGEVVFHKLPGEKLNAAALGEAATAGRHYPEVFRRLTGELSRPLAGELFLVAGGLLGKFYCDRIKRSGGVALDIGSLADLWAGAPTRPGYTREPGL